MHTPTPWKVKKVDNLPAECADNIIRPCYPGYRVEGVCAIWNNTETAKANAQFITRACNNHESLLVALKELQEFLDRALTELSDQDTGWYYQLKAATQKASKALAKAEGE